MEQVCVLLSTYNGGKYLNEQLKSIFAQEDAEILVIARDDGSTDNTLSILNSWKERTQRVVIPKPLMGFHCDNGVGSSFIMLLKYCVANYPEINYFAFADQDDVWKNDKVFRGIKALKKSGSEKALYFTKKSIVDENLRTIGKDTIRFDNNFCDFLSPNDASGCTMMFNRAFGELIARAPYEEMPFMHDSALMCLAICTDTKIIYDEYESIFYRQHSNNTVGERDDRLITEKNMNILFSKRRHYTEKEARFILSNYSGCLSEDVSEKLNEVLHHKNPFTSIRLLFMYYKESKRKIKDKLRFTATVLFNGL